MSTDGDINIITTAELEDEPIVTQPDPLGPLPSHTSNNPPPPSEVDPSIPTPDLTIHPPTPTISQEGADDLLEEIDIITPEAPQELDGVDVPSDGGHADEELTNGAIEEDVELEVDIELDEDVALESAGPLPVSSTPPSPTPKPIELTEVELMPSDATLSGSLLVSTPPVNDLKPELPRSTSTTSEGQFEEVELSLSDANPPAPLLQSEQPPPPPSHSPSPSPSPALATTPVVSSTPPASSSMSRSTTVSSLGGTHAGPRRSSVGSTTTISAPGSSSLVSGILIVSALESIAASKEAKKSRLLKDAVDRALDALKHPTPTTAPGSSGTVDPHVIFAPLRLACETKSLPLMITALDCIGKLVSYDFFIDRHPPPASAAADVSEEGEAPPLAEGEQLPLADLVTSTVCDCFSPSPTSTSSSSSSANNNATTQHDTLLLRLLSSLLSLILSSALSVHQSSLLKAVRTVYNVFLMGSPGTVQTVAQATLGQIVGGVFGRISLLEAAASNGAYSARAASSASSLSGSVNGSVAGSKVDLSTFAKEPSKEVNGKDKPVEDEEEVLKENGNAGEKEGQVEEDQDATGADLDKTPKLGPSTPVGEVEPLPLESHTPEKKEKTNGAHPPPQSINSGASTEDVTLYAFILVSSMACADLFFIFSFLRCCTARASRGEDRSRAYPKQDQFTLLATTISTLKTPSLFSELYANFR